MKNIGNNEQPNIFTLNKKTLENILKNIQKITRRSRKILLSTLLTLPIATATANNQNAQPQHSPVQPKSVLFEFIPPTPIEKNYSPVQLKNFTPISPEKIAPFNYTEMKQSNFPMCNFNTTMAFFYTKNDRERNKFAKNALKCIDDIFGINQDSKKEEGEEGELTRIKKSPLANYEKTLSYVKKMRKLLNSKDPKKLNREDQNNIGIISKELKKIREDTKSHINECK